MPNANEQRFLGDLRQRMTQAKTAVLRARPPIDETWRGRVQQHDEDHQSYELPELPLDKRFEGMWVIGRQGSGKTQFFKRQAGIDLDMVAAGDASLVVIDPVGCHPAVYRNSKRVSPATLIHTLTRLRRFYNGGDLEGRLIYIDPSDKQYTIPINLFSLRPELDDEDAIDAATDSYISIITGLMRQPLTPFQEPVLRYAVQAAMAFPNPTLATLREILAVQPPATKTYTPSPPVYQKILHKLEPDTQEYFRTTYDTQGPRASRSEVLNRLSNMTSSFKFRRIFGANKSTLDMAQLINEPNVIVINAARASLKSLTEVYGRYFLSMIRDAGLARPSGCIPCFVYVDECHQYIADDPITADIIFSLRQKNVALMLGNQSTRQIINKLTLDALLSTSIKLVNVREADGARMLAESMGYVDDNDRPIFRPLMARAPLNFAYHDSTTEAPVPYKFEPGILEAQPAMTEAEFAEIYEDIRSRFYEPVQRTRQEAAQEEAEDKAEDIDIEPPLPFQPAPKPTAPAPEPVEVAPASEAPPKPKQERRKPEPQKADEFDTDFEL
jgi:hypothetical protein